MLRLYVLGAVSEILHDLPNHIFIPRPKLGLRPLEPFGRPLPPFGHHSSHILSEVRVWAATNATQPQWRPTCRATIELSILIGDRDLEIAHRYGEPLLLAPP